MGEGGNDRGTDDGVDVVVPVLCSLPMGRFDPY